MSIDDIDLFEVNEAFASVPTAWLKTSGADRRGSRQRRCHRARPSARRSGTKLMTTLVNRAEVSATSAYGLQTMCEGGAWPT